MTSIWILLSLDMEALIHYLLRFGQLNEEQIELIKSKGEVISIKKGACFSEAGKIARRVGFVMEGVLRVCYYNEMGEDLTRLFISENHFAVDVNSFYSEIKSEVYIEAVTDCTLVVFSKTVFTELAEAIVGWNGIFTKMTSIALTNKLKASNNRLVQDAKTRYLTFLDLHPGLANRVPLSALASYLGITQSSLSRIRKSIS